jgi:hypothetical protein
MTVLCNKQTAHFLLQSRYSPLLCTHAQCDSKPEIAFERERKQFYEMAEKIVVWFRDAAISLEQPETPDAGPRK